jgi:hypothetical protein
MSRAHVSLHIAPSVVYLSNLNVQIVLDLQSRNQLFSSRDKCKLSLKCVYLPNLSEYADAQQSFVQTPSFSEQLEITLVTAHSVKTARNEVDRIIQTLQCSLIKVYIYNQCP